MSNLTSYPLQDGFETTLAQAWNGSTWTVYLATSPSFTFPSGVTTYIVVDPGKSNMQVAKIDSYDSGAKTVNVSSVTVNKMAGTVYSTWTHVVGAKVIISDNFAFWEDIKTAINTKLDQTGGNTSTTFDLDLSGSAFRIRKDGNDMKFTDDNTPETTLSQLASGGWADQKVAITINDTTTWVLDSKLTAGDGLKKTVVNPAGNETLDLDIDVADTTIFVKTSSGAGDENKIPVLWSSGKLAAWFVDISSSIAADADVTTWTDTTKAVNPSQVYRPLRAIASDNLRLSLDTERSRANTIAAPVKVFNVYKTGTYRVKFDLRISSGWWYVAYWQIYVNWIAYWTSRTDSTWSYTTKSQDLVFNDWDVVSLWINSSNNSYASIVRNLRIYNDVEFTTNTVLVTD